MEILAEKKHGLPWFYISYIIIGAFCLALAIVMFIVFLCTIGEIISVLPLLLVVAVGIFSIVIGTISLLRIKRSPDCIMLNGNQVDLGNGYIVNINQITDVDYREARARYSTYRWGTLTVYVDGQKIDYHYIDDVRHARDRMMQLIWQAKNGI